MKYYSETLNKLFDSTNDLEKAEKKHAEEEARKKELVENKKKQRAEDAKKVDEAFKALKEAEDNYHKVIDEFIKKYGYYHFTSTDAEDIPSAFSILKPFFDTWF